MNNYLVTFYNQPSIIVEAPNSTAALGLCIGRIFTYAEISDSRKTSMIDMFGLKFVKWPF